MLSVVLSTVAQDVIELGMNPKTGLNEIQINLTGMPEDATPLVMVLLPAGSFMMGSPPHEKDRGSDEEPHEVTIPKPFDLGKYEVTQAQWQAVMGSNPSEFKGKNLPVEQVSWDDCQKFVEKMSALGLGRFRLPAESEWEYACRAGTTTRFYWGDDLLLFEIGDHAWYDRNSNETTHEIGGKQPNAWGFFDMSGNVSEWCQDWRGYYPQRTETDSQSLLSRGGRVVRGGGWTDGAQHCRSALRFIGLPVGHFSSFGIRLLRSSR